MQILSNKLVRQMRYLKKKDCSEKVCAPTEVRVILDQPVNSGGIASALIYTVIG